MEFSVLSSVLRTENSILFFLSLHEVLSWKDFQGAKVELFYHLQVAGGSYERIPMGIFEVSEANRKAKCLEIKAYDYMVRF